MHEEAIFERSCITVVNSRNPSTGVYRKFTITLSQETCVVSLRVCLYHQATVVGPLV